MNHIRWGVLSTARIGLTKVIPAIQQSTHGQVTALASRRLEQARPEAERLGIPTVHGSYEALLADADVDAVYIPLPNHLHVPWAVKALEAGKHVLCEKPIGLNAAEAETLAEAARKHPHLTVWEAFMYRHHPQWQTARQLVREGAVGTLRTVHSAFSYYNDDPGNIRNQPALGGGGLMDIGCYSVSLSRFLFDAEPTRACALMKRHPRFGVDVLTSGMLEFTAGTATFTCSTQLERYQRVQILGTEGRIEIEAPFNPPLDAPTRLWLHAGGHVREHAFPAVNQFTLQADAFAQAIRNALPVPTPLSDAVANMRALDALAHSAAAGAWSKV